MNTKTMEMNQQQMEQVAGANILFYGCSHSGKKETGRQRTRESSFLFLHFCRHEIEYYCPDCEKTFWRKG